MPKEKLTLTVDKEVVEKAKKLNLNISEITETALKGFTFAPKEASPSDVYKSYETFFASMKPLLEKFGTNVIVASTDEDEYGEVAETHLNSDGSFWLWVFDEPNDKFTDITKIGIDEFCSPKQILSNLIDALARATERNKETLKELEVARRFVEAISATVQNRGQPNRPRSKKLVNPRKV